MKLSQRKIPFLGIVMGITIALFAQSSVSGEVIHTSSASMDEVGEIVWK